MLKRKRYTRSKQKPKRTRYSNSKLGYVYILKLIISDKEICYKVGYSNNPYRRINEYPFKCEMLYVFESTQSIAYKYEQLIHNNYSYYRYYPSIKFTGYTEVYVCIVGLKLLRDKMVCVFESEVKE